MKDYNSEKNIDGGYRLPWSSKDNPNGWIEPTTFCQLKCPGCYRGLDKENPKYVHEDLEKMKKQIDYLIENRNIQTLSVAGGEPLLYPQIKELLSYAKNKGLRTFIYTNGIALDKNMLEDLKRNGACQILVHIDKYQKRSDCRKEDIMKLRENYCRMFREVGGVNLGFIQPISADNLKDVFLLLNFCRKNVDVVNLVAFTLYREICWRPEVKKYINTNISVEDVVKEISDSCSYEPCAFLGSVNDPNDITWLFSISLNCKGREVGFLDKVFYSFVQERYHKEKGKYLFATKKNKIDVLKLFRYLNFKCIKEVLQNYFKIFMKNPSIIKEPIYFQTVLILRGPEKKEFGWDLCAGCPDAMLYEGKMVPSCILEDIKRL